MSNGIFKNPFLSTHSKKLLYLAIPINLLLWGCETWAVKKSDWKRLQVFHTTCIRKILRISMCDVQDFHISNTEILHKFDVKPIQDIAFSRQLYWLGKIHLMSDTRMPRKMLTCWLNTRRRTGRPHTTIRHTYLDALKRISYLCSLGNNQYPLVGTVLTVHVCVEKELTWHGENICVTYKIQKISCFLL